MTQQAGTIARDNGWLNAGLKGNTNMNSFNDIHNIQANTPVENIASMFKALEDAR